MRIAILGGPGSGKGTQAKLLADRYRVPQISTGDLLREAMKSDSALATEVQAAMDGGELVDNETVLELLQERLRQRDTKRGFIIDGYPRNIPQAQALDTLLGMLGKALQLALHMAVEDEQLGKRIIGRIGCVKCGAIYNRFFSPPARENVCDKCGAEALEARADDTPEVVQNRLRVYHEQTAPLITYYRAQHKLRTIAGEGGVDEIHQKFVDVIDLEIRPLEIMPLETAAESGEEDDTTIIAGGQINRIENERQPAADSKAKKVTARLATNDVPKAGKKAVAKGAQKRAKKKAADEGSENPAGEQEA